LGGRLRGIGLALEQREQLILLGGGGHVFAELCSLAFDLVGFDRTSLLGKERLQPLRDVPE
jgi:hypothetical protein